MSYSPNHSPKHSVISFVYKSDEINDAKLTPKPSPSDLELASINARELAAPFISACTLYTNAKETMEFAKRKHSEHANLGNILQIPQDILPDIFYAEAVKVFFDTASTYKNSLIKYRSETAQYSHMLLAYAQALKDRADRKLLEHYNSLSEAAKSFVCEIKGKELESIIATAAVTSSRQQKKL